MLVKQKVIGLFLSTQKPVSGMWKTEDCGQCRVLTEQYYTLQYTGIFAEKVSQENVISKYTTVISKVTRVIKSRVSF
jgi:hypothetical protein